ncbi:MAG: GyrI-like domain-containing protein, partial [Bryobacteraceae bacterium]|nr:GyrI-like domain-containing protein [Bryobacteraceae bacterium]
NLSLETIADAICVSRFHLSRAFSVSQGIPLATYVRARRLSEAARTLAEGAPSIIDVALDAGYSSHEAFTRAFRQQFALTPEQLRAQGHLENLNLLEPTRMDQTATLTLTSPRLVQSEAMLILGLSQRYNCEAKAGIPSQWDRFLPHMGHIAGQVGRVAYGVICNTDDAGNLEYLCGVQVTEFYSHPSEFTRLRIPPQTYAVFEHRDHISAIATSWANIWNQALTESGYHATDGPAFERYGEEFDGRTGFGGLELWVPVRA